MKVLTAYIRQNRRILVFYFGAMAVFFVLLFFYRIPVAGWAYGAALCLVFGLVLGVPDYLRFRKKHRELRQMGERQEITGAELLPVPEGLLEQDYQDLIARLLEKEKDTQDRLNRRYQDMSDYYTMWAHQVKTPIAALKLSLENEDSSLAREVRGEVVRIDQYVDIMDNEIFSLSIETFPWGLVYFKLFESTCSITKRSHFSSVTAFQSIGSYSNRIFFWIKEEENFRTAWRMI